MCLTREELGPHSQVPGWAAAENRKVKASHSFPRESLGVSASAATGRAPPGADQMMAEVIC